MECFDDIPCRTSALMVGRELFSSPALQWMGIKFDVLNDHLGCWSAVCTCVCDLSIPNASPWVFGFHHVLTDDPRVQANNSCEFARDISFLHCILHSVPVRYQDEHIKIFATRRMTKWTTYFEKALTSNLVDMVFLHLPALTWTWMTIFEPFAYITECLATQDASSSLIWCISTRCTPKFTWKSSVSYKLCHFSVCVLVMGLPIGWSWLYAGKLIVICRPVYLPRIEWPWISAASGKSIDLSPTYECSWVVSFDWVTWQHETFQFMISIFHVHHTWKCLNYSFGMWMCTRTVVPRDWSHSYTWVLADLVCIYRVLFFWCSTFHRQHVSLYDSSTKVALEMSYDALVPLKCSAGFSTIHFMHIVLFMMFVIFVFIVIATEMLVENQTVIASVFSQDLRAGLSSAQCVSTQSMCTMYRLFKTFAFHI